MAVYILRGIPGSGKSTFIKEKLLPALKYKPLIVSADHYFEGPEGYKFDPSLISKAHATCIKAFVEGCSRGVMEIVVDNTNTTALEVSTYYNVAKAFGYEVNIVTCAVSAREAADRNLHGVPFEACDAMSYRLENEPLPSFWEYKQHFYTNGQFFSV